MSILHDHDALPDILPITKSRIEKWRAKRRPRERMPEHLWREAAGYAKVQGVHKVAKALRLDYYSLKKRVTADEELRKTVPDFIEVLREAVPAARPECVIEIEDGSGAKLRISLCGREIPDIPALTRAFREGKQ